MATITLKNIPDDLYERLKAQARLQRRSINGEMIRCLEILLRPRRMSVEERLERLRALRPRLDPDVVTQEEIRRAIADGRP